MRYIVTIDYRDYLVSKDVNIGEVMNLLSSLICVSLNGYGKDAVYVPGDRIQVKLLNVDDDQVRPFTEDEEQKKELSNLKYQVENLERRLKEANDANKELECINKALCEKELLEKE